MSEEEIMEILRSRLRLDVKTTREYTGGMSGDGNLYQDHHTIQLILDDEVISEISL
jgi:hypothetical protein